MADGTLGLALRNSGDPMYRQIFDQIADRIRSGVLPDGYRLPPTRALAGSLGAHRNTVVRAYAELEAAGFIAAAVGRGSFVTAPPEDAATESPTPITPSLPWSSLLSGAARSEPMRRFVRLRRSVVGSRVVDLTRLQPPAELLPHELFRRCVDHVLRTDGTRAMGYAPNEGFRSLRGLIAADLARRGVPASLEDVLVTTGSQQGLDLMARALLDPGDVVLTHTSTYAGALQVFAATGAHVIGVPSDGEGPDVEALRRLGMRRPKMLYLMPNHVNPTGACMSEARRRAVLAWARDAQVAVIEDDYAADLVLDDVPTPPALRALDRDVVHLGSFSKRLIPSLRIGYLVVPPALHPHLIAFKHTSDLGSSALGQLALAEFLDRGYLRAHLNRIGPTYRARRDALLDALRLHVPHDVRWQRPSRGISAWIELPPSIDPERVFQEALARDVLIGSGTHFSVDGGAPPGVRLSFCHEPEDRLREGAKRLADALAAVRDKGTNGQAVELV